MKLLLHACCGPCSLEPVRLLHEEGHNLSIFFTNSNIAPAEEYAQRLNALLSWAQRENIPVIEGNYCPEQWESTAGLIGNAALVQASALQTEQLPLDPTTSTLTIDPHQREARCRACYRLRFEEAARFAAENKFDAIGTTLSVSPYQYTFLIEEELRRAAQRENIQTLFRDYRPYYPQATQRSKDYGMYRQNYCGCRFSDDESQAQRFLRKKEREAIRHAKQAVKEQQAAQDLATKEQKMKQQQAYAEKQARKRSLLKALREQNSSL